ncbi:MAG: hypothetical protein H0W36_16045 [Gemmatimonadetes bacterium]|nr:hypothetical protein [Gemmatimonadota bacterium]
MRFRDRDGLIPRKVEDSRVSSTRWRTRRRVFNAEWSPTSHRNSHTHLNARRSRPRDESPGHNRLWAAVRLAAPNAEPWAIERALAIYTDMLRCEAGDVALLSAFAVELTAAASPHGSHASGTAT